MSRVEAALPDPKDLRDGDGMGGCAALKYRAVPVASGSRPLPIGTWPVQILANRATVSGYRLTR